MTTITTSTNTINTFHKNVDNCFRDYDKESSQLLLLVLKSFDSAYNENDVLLLTTNLADLQCKISVKSSLPKEIIETIDRINKFYQTTLDPVLSCLKSCQPVLRTLIKLNLNAEEFLRNAFVNSLITSPGSQTFAEDLISLDQHFFPVNKDPASSSANTERSRSGEGHRKPRV